MAYFVRGARIAVAPFVNMEKYDANNAMTVTHDERVNRRDANTVGSNVFARNVGVEEFASTTGFVLYVVDVVLKLYFVDIRLAQLQRASYLN